MNFSQILGHLEVAVVRSLQSQDQADELVSLCHAEAWAIRLTKEIQAEKLRLAVSMEIPVGTIPLEEGLTLEAEVER